jgi:hypothetical protein
VEIEGDEEWLVDSVLDTRESYGKRMYLVRWEGFTKEHDSWEPETNLENAQDKITEFYARQRR